MQHDSGRTEILAPAGSFSSAVYAYRNGADAVYLGLPKFSARKSAKNLTLEELSRLRTAFPDRRIYVAANTVIREGEIDELLETLYRAWLLGVHGIIVQDYGLPGLIQRHFPGLPVHASTQMAVHNAAGVRALMELGFSRIILARELTFDEIRAVREECPGIELEVFVHGALCYGFSGLCLASGLLLGRSGNRGECAQVCRSWFENGKTRSYMFSTNDLVLGNAVLSLRDIGVTSFKIEGRMKPPEYAGTASAYYRAVLDGLPETEQEKRLKAVQTVFSRRRTQAFFNNPRGEDLLNPEFPSHVGIPLGRVESVDEGGFTLTLEEPLSVRDGILFPSSGPEPVRTGVSELRKNGKRVFDAYRGDTVRIPSKELPLRGAEVRKISDHSLTWPDVPASTWQKTAFTVPVTAELTDSALTLEGILPLPLGVDVEGATVRLECEAAPEPARNPKDFGELLSGVLGESGEYPFKAELTRFDNRSSFGRDGIFLPPSAVKRMRQDFYRELDRVFGELAASVPGKIRAGRLSSGGADGIAVPPYAGAFSGASIPERSILVPRGEAPVPFVTDPARLDPGMLPLFEGKRYLPLAPVVFDEHAYFKALSRFLGDNAGLGFVLGLNNASHLGRAKELSRRGNVEFYVDYGLYCANLESYLTYVRMVPELRFVYSWIEGTAEDHETLAEAVRKLGTFMPGLPPVAHIERGFSPPLFVSRFCPRRHAFGGSCHTCDAGKSFDAMRPVQNGRRFLIASRHCITYVFASPDGSSGEEEEGFREVFLR